jgi:DNA processing protein
MNDLSALPYYLCFARTKGIGVIRLRKLISHFGSVSDAWNAKEFDLYATGLDEKSLRSLVNARKVYSPENELERLRKANASAVCWEDKTYPRLLKEVDDPPPVLIIKGELKREDEFAIGIVGTRRATVYGKEVTTMLATELSQNKITVISGLARGIDAHAHQAAINANGRTIAVLGCGVDQLYPPENRKLSEQIVEHGAIVSDYPIGTPPDKSNFPPRNRIISGLTLGVVVVEADERSGAMITAQFALEHGRDVFAVPGNIFNRSSKGTNKLIRDGATPVLDTNSILEQLNLSAVADRNEVKAVVPENDTEKKIVSRLSYEPTLIDDIVRELSLPIDAVTSALALMELKGMVRQANGASYVLARESKIEYKVG